VPKYWRAQRAFSNLLVGTSWGYADTARNIWNAGDPGDRVSPDGKILYLKPGEFIKLIITPPTSLYNAPAADVKCTFEGEGALGMAGSTLISNVKSIANGVIFTWNKPTGWSPEQPLGVPWLKITKTNSSDPVRNLDCREVDADPKALFDPTFLEDVSKYKVARFMDWQNTNANKAITWETRTTPATILRSTAEDGIPVELMVALANQAGTDAWFTIPWNADENYVRRFAQYVKDNLDPSHKVYVEVSNEVWNGMFSVFHQAAKEGAAENLYPADPFQALLYRYSEKSAWALKIWSQVFAGQNDRLVRVVSSQNQHWIAQKILEFRDTAQYVDALAVAPYFGSAMLKGTDAGITDTDALFAQLSADIDTTFKKTASVAAVAKPYNIRLITYEAGQHLVPSSGTMHITMNRDPRMANMYDKYLKAWKAQFGDLMMLYSDTGLYSKYGAFAMQEYPGQPLSQAPKRRAVAQFMSASQ
tara:strand:- start:84265 stop:85689 length:1425 start_codon:yes stop_codon:yes gene_type:complete